VDVPWKSRSSATASKSGADCGSVALAMVLAFYGTDKTANEVFDATGAVPNSALTIEQLQKAASAFGFELVRQDSQTVESLKSGIDEATPAVCLVKAKYLDRQTYTAGQFVVVVGYDDAGGIICHDPNQVGNDVGGPLVTETHFWDAWSNCHEDGNPDRVMLTLERITPPGTTIRGLHMRSGGPCRDSDFECVRIAGLKAAKLTTENPPETVDRLVALGVPAESVVVRLFADLSDRTAKPEEFCDWMKLPIQLFMAKGVRYFEVHNEPNLPQEGLGVAWPNAQSFATWYSAVVQILRRDHPGIKVGFPGLSPQPNVAEWLTACDSVMRSSDWIGVHCYWTDASLMSHPEHGGYYQRFVAEFPDQELIISEFSNPSPSVSKGEKGKQYKAYWQQLPSNIKTACCFISSSPSFPYEAWADESENISEIPYNVK